MNFPDSSNEKKYDQLVKAQKLKSPFKRRLSAERADNGAYGHQMDCKKTKKEHVTDQDGRSRTSSSSSSSGSLHNLGKNTVELETDTGVLERRQKQIDYGKNTVGYENYIAQVPL